MLSRIPYQSSSSRQRQVCGREIMKLTNEPLAVGSHRNRTFKKIYLEILNRCNLKCSFCPPDTRPAQFLTLPDFQYFLEKLQGWGSYLYFHVKGEPLLHPQFPQFLETAGAYGFQVNLTTNGTLLEKHSEVLWNAKTLRQLNLSLQAWVELSPEQEDHYFDVLFSFLDEHPKRSQSFISLRLWHQNTAEADKNNERLLTRLETYLGVHLPRKEALNPETGFKLSEKLYLNSADRFEWPDLNLPQADTKGFCYGLSNQVGILSDGTVVPCCLDGEGIIALGNLKNQSLEEILASPRSVALHEGFLHGELVEPLCRTCGFRRRFTRVPSKRG